jgi:carbonic anhydrase/acetyltransferase-like protein (isoleucine patch superfamily)
MSSAEPRLDLKPFNTPLDDCLVVDRTFSEWREQALRSVLPRVEKHGLTLDWDPRVFCTEGFLRSFVTDAIGIGVPAQAAVRLSPLHDAFGVNPTGIDEPTNPLRYPLRLTREGSSTDSMKLIECAQTGEVTKKPRPGRMDNPILMPFEPDFIWRVGHWSDLLTVNLLMLQVVIKDINSEARGHGCNVHPSAVVEGSILGNDVTIGPFAVVQNSIVADGAVIQEYGSAVASTVGAGSVVQTHAQVRESVVGENTVVSYQCAVRNSVLMGNSSISAPVVVRSVIGTNVILTRGLGISATTLGDDPIRVWHGGKRVNSGLQLLGCAVGDDARVGSGLDLPMGYQVPAGYYLASRPLGRLANDLPRHAPLIEVAGTFRRLGFSGG